MDSAAWQLAGIFFLTWLSEDAAVLGAAIAAASGALPVVPCFLSCFAGLWSGDFLLFLIARHGGRPLAERFLGHGAGSAAKLEKSEAWFRRRGILALAISRFVPGLRLTTFLAAGFLRMNAILFAIVTGVMAAIWAVLIFALARVMGKAAPATFDALRGHLYLIMGGSLLILGVIHLVPRLVKWLRRWEFWPAWLFYLPIAVRYVTLAVRYGSLTLPSAANPCMKTGGLIGESKFEILRDLKSIAPEFVPDTELIPVDGDRMAALQRFMASGGITYPVVLKPDLGFRGSGFKIARSEDQAAAYLSAVTVPIIAQRYVAGPFEAGLFYCRMPDEERGRIMAITEKVFPELIGDGMHRIEELILADERARLQAATLLKRFQKRLNDVPPGGEIIRLVEAGNHAQGCLFRDGMHLNSSQLEEKIHSISRRLNGFFIGRFDVRYSTTEDLKSGHGFSIIELNGVAGEPTSAYDASKSILSAFSLLFRHWELAFAVGAANRRAGHHPDSIRTILREYRAYGHLKSKHPVAD
jgi:membrane protein DedA with SNARE-associated domain